MSHVADAHEHVRMVVSYALGSTYCALLQRASVACRCAVDSLSHFSESVYTPLPLRHCHHLCHHDDGSGVSNWSMIRSSWGACKDAPPCMHACC